MDSDGGWSGGITPGSGGSGGASANQQRVADSGSGGPVISKWEHLPLLPELLRSISKYGCVLILNAHSFMLAWSSVDLFSFFLKCGTSEQNSAAGAAFPPAWS